MQGQLFWTVYIMKNEEKLVDKRDKITSRQQFVI